MILNVSPNWVATVLKLTALALGLAAAGTGVRAARLWRERA